ncbi:Double Clp-N motif-containing P-loop nucleoside triphosphate hydrolases superfamily protein [Perilla frutescens var. hirtella]|uniref:Double Clp-N motif-containing P-loop nucleoside triphosphate hydrolases superfamily protein n=1 Tax=Perilla frutescens var. hirtella TaxID=608512 RepID=A0AAD4IPF7_PERFH|nr:Double Clp-N motif-containing P-loop nucleoside triphosphate hydrolases superfamily protein [Perilla frutescens var. hirtella]
MRAGGNCAVQQSLTAEAAGVVKQAVLVAKRRGHAQVTPLHVANTMLAAATGLFRVACLESHSHPLQCKALELCFNVALNRLTASAANPMLGASAHSPNHPSISNALVAAFKRAQAHQRRGSVESQQQPLLAVKIELEQLIISILDDPSVSRVMREAGFSSTQVKINVEKAISLQLCSSPASPKPKHMKENTIDIDIDINLSSSPSSSTSQSDEIKVSARSEQDLKVVMDNLVKKKGSMVLVGESIYKLESTVKNLMDRVDRGEVGEGLREVKFISMPPLYSFCNLEREQVEVKIRELTCLVQSLVRRGKGAVLYLGDLKWISDYRVSLEREGRGRYYCSVEHMMMEIGRLVWGFGEMESDEKSEGSRAENGVCSNDRAFSRLPSWLKGEHQTPRLNHKHLQKNSEGMREELCKKYWNSGQKLPTSLTSSPRRSHFLSQHWINHPNPRNIELEQVDFDNNMMDVDDCTQKLKEFNAENLNLLCNALEEKVPCQKEIIPDIAGTILQCRSGMLRRKKQKQKPQLDDVDDVKEETWLLFLGPDQSQAKEKIARELARIVFGSYSSFVSITFIDSCRNKRGREDDDDDDECRKSYVHRFARAVSENPRRVFFVEDFEQADYSSQMGLKRAIEKGRIVNENGHELALCDAIVILSCESFSSTTSRASNHQQTENGIAGAGVLLDLNISFDVDRDDVEKQSSVDELGILENVDRRLVFKIHDLRQ